MYQHIIYDFDGTLSDSYPRFQACFLQVIANRGETADPDETMRLLKKTFDHAYRHYAITKEEAREFSRLIRAWPQEDQYPIAGALDILKYAAETGRKNYIYTHSPAELVTKLLDGWGFSPYITDMVDKNFHLPPKPAPDGTLMLMRRNGMEPAETLMVGDRDLDIESGHNAGIAGALLDPEGFFPDLACEYRIDSLSELKAIL